MVPLLPFCTTSAACSSLNPPDCFPSIPFPDHGAALGRKDQAVRSYKALLSLKEATREQKEEAGRRLRDLSGQR